MVLILPILLKIAILVGAVFLDPLDGTPDSETFFMLPFVRYSPQLETCFIDLHLFAMYR